MTLTSTPDANFIKIDEHSLLNAETHWRSTKEDSKNKRLQKKKFGDPQKETPKKLD
jgi:hypothetical protein